MTLKLGDLRSQISNLKSKVQWKALPRGFTLVEVLVVIAIIGMLVGLLLPAVMYAKTSAKRTVVKSDMTQLMGALESFRTSVGNGQYPPDGTNVADLQQFCRAAWPRVYWTTGNPAPNYSANPPVVPYPKITPDTALCFWLGGAQDAASPTAAAPGIPHFIGFSANPSNPFDSGASRTPPTFEFDRTRVNSSPTGNILTSGVSKSGLPPGPANSNVYYNLYQYYPPNGKDMTSGTYAPYVYYKAVPVTVASNHVYTDKQIVNGTTQLWSWQPETSLMKAGALIALPYLDSTSTTIPQAFVNPQSYQLLCPGLDGIYGATTDTPTPLPPKYPSGSNYNQTNGIDDMTNFTQGVTVGNDTQ
jgi:prepilin-type N-terminal cleavage/methylation domain-containing protein